MFIREDRKSVSFTRKLAFDLGYQKVTRSPQNQSYNFRLLSMPRLRRSYRGLTQTLDVVSPSLFHMFIKEDHKFVTFQEKSCFSYSSTIEMKNGLITDHNRH